MDLRTSIIKTYQEIIAEDEQKEQKSELNEQPENKPSNSPD